MSVELNHTIVHVSDKNAAAEDLAEILGVDPPTSFGPFRVLTLANGVSLDFADDHGEPDGQHYAFMVGRPFPPARGRDQHPRRGPWPLLGRSRRPQPRDHHRPVRRVSHRALAVTRRRPHAPDPAWPAHGR